MNQHLFLMFSCYPVPLLPKGTYFHNLTFQDHILVNLDAYNRAF